MRREMQMAKNDETAKSDASTQHVTSQAQDADARPEQASGLRVKTNLRAGTSGWGTSGWGAAVKGP
jgi:hypothetical protein